jgi:16S rRNA (cytosine967-C5)-methyltransferase
MPEQVITECPNHAYERLKNLFGDDFETEMQAMMDPATLDIRVNTIKIDPQGARDMLAKDKIETEPCPYSPVGLRLKSKAYLAHSKAFKKGMIEIQDEGSQLLALIANAKPGQQVLDYCAGGGGKTLALAAAMQGKGRIVAMDIDARRLAKAKPRLTKADVHNVELRPILDDKHKKWLRRQKETFDVVLVDAPCTSSGTWRRNPDLRWNHYGPSEEEIREMQTDILDKVWDKVKKGGRLIYATCSLYREENEMQVENFLQNHPEFKLIPAPQAWAETGMETPCPVDADYLRLSPAQHHTDGFFAAILERVA